MQRRLENYLTDEDSLKRLRYKTLRAEIAARIAERQNHSSNNASNDCDDPVISGLNTTVKDVDTTSSAHIAVEDRSERKRATRKRMRPSHRQREGISTPALSIEYDGVGGDGRRLNERVDDVDNAPRKKSSILIHGKGKGEEQQSRQVGEEIFESVRNRDICTHRSWKRWRKLSRKLLRTALSPAAPPLDCGDDNGFNACSVGEEIIVVDKVSREIAPRDKGRR